MSAFHRRHPLWDAGTSLRYENRPFATMEEMDQELIRRWNEKSGEGDTVFHLGIFPPGGRRTGPSSPSWPGKRCWCWATTTGTVPRRSGALWDLKRPFPGPWCGRFFLLSHEPLYINGMMPYANVFGHVHGNPAYRDASARSVCVSVERTGFAASLKRHGSACKPGKRKRITKRACAVGSIWPPLGRLSC